MLAAGFPVDADVSLVAQAAVATISDIAAKASFVRKHRLDSFPTRVLFT
jgi:hypothetical protein